MNITRRSLLSMLAAAAGAATVLRNPQSPQSAQSGPEHSFSEKVETGYGYRYVYLTEDGREYWIPRTTLGQQAAIEQARALGMLAD